MCLAFCFVKQKPAYELRISDWSSDVCSSDLLLLVLRCRQAAVGGGRPGFRGDDLLVQRLDVIFAGGPGGARQQGHGGACRESLGREGTESHLGAPDRKSVV